MAHCRISIWCIGIRSGRTGRLLNDISTSFHWASVWDYNDGVHRVETAHNKITYLGCHIGCIWRSFMSFFAGRWCHSNQQKSVVFVVCFCDIGSCLLSANFLLRTDRCIKLVVRHSTRLCWYELDTSVCWSWSDRFDVSLALEYWTDEYTFGFIGWEYVACRHVGGCIILSLL